MEFITKSFGEKSFWGYIWVGVASLLAGIVMFFFVVKRDMEIDEKVPRDVQLYFTIVYVNQNNFKNSTGRFNPALNMLEVDQEVCRRFLCLLTLTPDGQDYTFKLTRGEHTWAINSKSPHPKEVTQ